MESVSGRTTDPETSAQYPNPCHARTMDTATETVRARISQAATAGNCMARFSRARWTTDALLMKIVTSGTRAWVDLRGLRTLQLDA